MAMSLALKNFPNVKELKPVQEEAIMNYITRKDVLCVLPTGYGKSLIFQVIPGICSHLHDKGFEYPSNPILLVICPLNSLISSHLSELLACGISACSLSDANISKADRSSRREVFGCVR